MTFIEIMDTFAFYGLDVFLLALLCCIVVQLLKRTVLKKVQKKVYTFLPFICGGAIYAVYFLFKNLSFACFAKGYISVVEHGFAVGSLSTVMYVWYEQFVRRKAAGNTARDAVCSLLEGYVPEEKLIEAAQKICDGEDAEELLATFGVGGVEAKALAELIKETLAHTNSQP